MAEPHMRQVARTLPILFCLADPLNHFDPQPILRKRALFLKWALSRVDSLFADA